MPRHTGSLELSPHRPPAPDRLDQNGCRAGHISACTRDMFALARAKAEVIGINFPNASFPSSSPTRRNYAFSARCVCCQLLRRIFTRLMKVNCRPKRALGKPHTSTNRPRRTRAHGRRGISAYVRTRSRTSARIQILSEIPPQMTLFASTRRRRPESAARPRAANFNWAGKVELLPARIQSKYITSS